MFRELRYPGLSLMYKTLGCFHSLQPSENAFEAPSVPCLLVPGFVRWQTVQLLLQPNEHARCMQRAVELYDVPAPQGGCFPKTIPRESFPLKPDEAMEKWQNAILDRLDDGPKQLKSSPYNPPFDRPVDREGYFSRNGNHSRRSSRTRWPDSQELPSRPSPSHRRSSLSGIPSVHEPSDAFDPRFQWSSDQAFNSSQSAVPRSPRSRLPGSHRHPSQPHQRVPSSHNAESTNTPATDNSSSKSFSLNLESLHLPFISSPFSSKKQKKRSSFSPPRIGSRQRSSRSHEAVSSGSEASSEDSLPPISHPERDGRRRSLAPSDAYNPYRRRHSHDDSSRQKYGYAPAGTHQRPFPVSPSHPYNPSTSVPHPSAIRDNLFNGEQYRTASAPDPSSVGPHPTVRVVEPAGGVNTRGRGDVPTSPSGNIQDRRAASGRGRSRSDGRHHSEHERKRGHGGSDWSGHESPRKQGKPLRINTVGGLAANGPRVRAPGIKTAVSPSFKRVPPVDFSVSGRR